MDPRKQLLATLSMLALSLGGASAPTQAAQSNVQAMFDNLQCLPGQLEEECACEAALNENTIDALEEFLRRYPPENSGPTACSALATTALLKFTEGSRGDPPEPPGGGPY